MTHQKFKGYVPGNWERTRKSWLPLPNYDTWASTRPCTVNWQNEEWFHQRTLQTNLFPALVHPVLNYTPSKHTVKCIFSEVHFLEKRDNRYGRILLLLSRYYSLYLRMKMIKSEPLVIQHDTKLSGFVKVGCTPVQWRLDRWGKPQETNNIVVRKIESAF